MIIFLTFSDQERFFKKLKKFLVIFTCNQFFSFLSSQIFLQEIPAFDTHLNKWSTVYTHCDPINNLIPAARRCHGLVNYIEGDTGTPVVVISGGYNGGQMFDDVWKLDLVSKQWTCLRLSLMPVPLYFHSTAITPSGRMYSFGGITKEGNEVNIFVLNNFSEKLKITITNFFADK